MDSKPIIGYWKIRGLGANLRYQLKYSGVEYELQEYVQGPGPDFSRADWMDKKFTLGLPFPNLPYLIHGDFKLTETMAIHKYFAEMYDQALLGKNAVDKARVTMFAGVIGGLKMKVTMPCYVSGDKNEIIEAYKAGMPEILKNKGNHAFLVGDYPTYIDFYFYEMCQACDFAVDGQLFKDYPELVSYSLRVQDLKGLKEYFADPNCHDAALTFNNTVAKINGTRGFQ